MANVVRADRFPNEKATWTLASRACERWPELVDGRIQALKIRENAVFLVTNASSQRFVLRAHRPGYHSDQSLESEYAWMAALRQHGVLTPTLVRSGSGRNFEHVLLNQQSYQVDAFEWIEGSAPPFPPGGGGAPVEHIIERYRLMGQAMRRIHDQSRGWSPPHPFERHSWDVNGLTGESPVWGRFWELDQLNAQQRGLMDTLRAALRRDLADLGTTPDIYGLIHADLMPDNVIVSHRGLYVIDFDDAGFGWYLYDVAVSLFSFTSHPQFERILRSFMAGYHPGELPTEQELSTLDLFLAARGATLLGWLHSRGHEQAPTPWLIQLACAAATRWLRARQGEKRSPS